MRNKNSEAEGFLSVLKNYQQHSRAEVLKSLHELRYNTGIVDDSVLLAVLDSQDDGIVASALFSLWHSHGVRRPLLHTIRDLSRGDGRDSGEMPIQSFAITVLADLAKENADDLHLLRSLAEDPNTPDVPRKRAWQGLAEFAGMDWMGEYSDRLLESFTSEESLSIIARIRAAVEKRLSTNG